MIKHALPYLYNLPIVFMTDSAFVLQVLEEHCSFSSHPHDIHELLYLWKQVYSRVSKQHVKGHSGHPLNSLTDRAAKAALLFQHDRVLYRTADFSKVYLVGAQQAMPVFHPWLG